MEIENRQIILKRLTSSVAESDMELRSVSVPLSLPVSSDIGCNNIDVLVKNIYLSCDPYMRNRIRGNKTSYISPFQPGSVIEGFGVSTVICSNHPDFKEGDFVTGMTGWEDYSVIKNGSGLRKITSTDVPLTYHLGILGMPGLTAYGGFYKLGSPKKGDQVFVSAASGAVGQLVGQFAKIMGCRVVGSAGSQEKVNLLKSKFGFDDGFNYKEEKDLTLTLKRYFPEGIDIYFENVGGKMLEAVLNNMKMHGHILVCGMISQAFEGGGVSNLIQLTLKCVKMEGFLMSEFLPFESEFVEFVKTLLKEGKLVYVEDVAHGLEKAASALVGIFQGRNIGKQIVSLK